MAVLASALASEARGAPAPAALSVSTTPPGAKIHVDGYLKGVSPATVTVTSVRTAPSRHRLTLALEGHEGCDEIVWLKGGGDKRIERRLIPQLDTTTPLADLIPDGASADAHTVADIDGDADLELVILYSMPGEEARPVNLVVFDQHEGTLKKSFQHQIGSAPARLLPVEDVTGDEIHDILCEAHVGEKELALSVVSHLAGAEAFSQAQYGLVCHYRFAVDGLGLHVLDVNGDGIAEFLVSPTPPSPVSEADPPPLGARWRLLYWTGSALAEMPSFGDYPLRPSVPIVCRPERMEGVAERPWHATLPLSASRREEPGQADLRARFSVSWDASHLILSVRVTDDQVVYGDPRAGDARGDHLELWIDSDLERDLPRDAPDDDDLQLLLFPGDFVGTPPALVATRPTRRTVANVRIEATRTATGYHVLAYLPHSVTGIGRPEHGRVVGFALAVHDVDEAGLDSTRVVSSPVRFREGKCTTFGNLLFVGE